MADILLSIEREELLSAIDLVVGRTQNIDFSWDWPCAVAFYGISKAWQVTGRDEYMDFLKSWVDEYMEIGLPPYMVNSAAMGHVLLSLHQYCSDDGYLQLAREKAEHLVHDAPRFGDRIIQHTVSAKNDFPGQAWADTLFMAAYFLLRIGVYTDNASYVSEALHQYLGHEELLQDEQTNFFYHGYDSQSDSHMSGVYWARANAWAAITMAEAKRHINYLYPEFMAIDCALRDQLAALVRVQSPNGLWHTVLDDSSSYEEVSASAGIGAAMVINGHPLHRKAMLSAYEGIRRNIGADGSVRNVSGGTAVMESAADYHRVPKKRVQGWGQGLTLAFFAALLEHIDAAEH